MPLCLGECSFDLPQIVSNTIACFMWMCPCRAYGPAIGSWLAEVRMPSVACPWSTLFDLQKRLLDAVYVIAMEYLIKKINPATRYGGAQAKREAIRERGQAYKRKLDEAAAALQARVEAKIRTLRRKH